MIDIAVFNPLTVRDERARQGSEFRILMNTVLALDSVAEEKGLRVRWGGHGVVGQEHIDVAPIESLPLCDVLLTVQLPHVTESAVHQVQGALLDNLLYYGFEHRGSYSELPEWHHRQDNLGRSYDATADYWFAMYANALPDYGFMSDSQRWLGLISWDSETLAEQAKHVQCPIAWCPYPIPNRKSAPTIDKYDIVFMMRMDTMSAFGPEDELEFLRHLGSHHGDLKVLVLTRGDRLEHHPRTLRLLMSVAEIPNVTYIPSLPYNVYISFLKGISVFINFVPAPHYYAGYEALMCTNCRYVSILESSAINKHNPYAVSANDSRDDVKSTLSRAVMNSDKEKSDRFRRIIRRLHSLTTCGRTLADHIRSFVDER